MGIDTEDRQCKTKEEMAISKPRKDTSEETKQQYLALKLLASRNMRDNVVLHGPQCFILTAMAAEDKATQMPSLVWSQRDSLKW